MAASSFPLQQRSFFSISVAIWSAVYLYNAYGTTYFQAALRLTVKRNRGRVNVSRRYWMYEDIICAILRIGYTLDLVRVCCEPAYWWKRKLNAGSEQRSHRYRPVRSMLLPAVSLWHFVVYSWPLSIKSNQIWLQQWLTDRNLKLQLAEMW